MNANEIAYIIVECMLKDEYLMAAIFEWLEQDSHQGVTS